jgi:hypothetical protein
MPGFRRLQNRYVSGRNCKVLKSGVHTQNPAPKHLPKPPLVSDSPEIPSQRLSQTFPSNGPRIHLADLSPRRTLARNGLRGIVGHFPKATSGQQHRLRSNSSPNVRVARDPAGTAGTIEALQIPHARWPKSQWFEESIGTTSRGPVAATGWSSPLRPVRILTTGRASGYNLQEGVTV